MKQHNPINTNASPHTDLNNTWLQEKEVFSRCMTAIFYHSTGLLWGQPKVEQNRTTWTVKWNKTGQLGQWSETGQVNLDSEVKQDRSTWTVKWNRTGQLGQWSETGRDKGQLGQWSETRQVNLDSEVKQDRSNTGQLGQWSETRQVNLDSEVKQDRSTWTVKWNKTGQTQVNLDSEVKQDRSNTGQLGQWSETRQVNLDSEVKQDRSNTGQLGQWSETRQVKHRSTWTVKWNKTDREPPCSFRNFDQRQAARGLGFLLYLWSSIKVKIIQTGLKQTVSSGYTQTKFEKGIITIATQCLHLLTKSRKCLSPLKNNGKIKHIWSLSQHCIWMANQISSWSNWNFDRKWVPCAITTLN